MPKHPHYPQDLVSRDEVSDLVEEGWALVQVDLDPEAYDQGHLPGALAWNWETQLRNPETKDILSQDEFEALMGASGIRPETPVILYGDNNNWFACWGVWLMHRYGHNRVRLLDGGLRAWMEAGLPLSLDRPAPTPVPYAAAPADQGGQATTEDVFTAFFSPDTHCLVDVRSSAEFEGSIASPGVGMEAKCAVSGHIPTAVSIPWHLNCNPDGTFKAPGELREVYAGRGISPEKTVIAYCAIGERASLSWFVLKRLLGYGRAMNYDRSMSQWSRIPNAPVEVGLAA